MSFEEEWADLKAAAQERLQTGTRLAGVGTSPAPGRMPGAQNLGLDAAPVRRIANRTHTENSESGDSNKLADAEAAGRAHPGWECGPVSNDCVDAWQGRLRGLSSLVADAADGLNGAMDEQIGGDRSVADQLRSGAEWLENA